MTKAQCFKMAKNEKKNLKKLTNVLDARHAAGQ